jgi:hypothetical protein
LDPKKIIKDYNINYGNNEVHVAVPLFFFGSQYIIKLMRVAGFW